MKREELIQKLQRKFGVSTTLALVNVLQDEGLVADEAIELEDCADRDLIFAYQG